MKRALLSLSPLLASPNVCYRTTLAGLKPRISLSACSTFSTPAHTRAFHALRTPPSVLPERSILQFLSSRISQATHRSGVRRGRSGGSYGGGPQGPWQRLRARINSIPSNVIFWGIIGLNGIVFVSWNLAWIKYVRYSLNSRHVPWSAHGTPLNVAKYRRPLLIPVDAAKLHILFRESTWWAMVSG